MKWWDVVRWRVDRGKAYFVMSTLSKEEEWVWNAVVGCGHVESYQRKDLLYFVHMQ